MKRVLFTVALLICGCSRHDPETEIHFNYSDGTSSRFETTVERQLNALSVRDPLEDAAKAFRSGDYRLVAILGVGLNVPGVQIDSSTRLVGSMQKIGMKTISGTSDAFVNERHERMNAKAHEYAKAYNAQMLILLTTNGKG